MMPTRLRCLLVGLCWILLGWTAATAATAATVVVVSSERSAVYAETADALARELERGGLPRQEVLHIAASEWSASAHLNPKLYIALGAQATDLLAVAELRAPVLATLLPRASFERSLRLSDRKPSAQFSALYLDQPLSRQLDLIRLALPAVHRIGVLWGQESLAQSSALKALALAKGLTLAEARVGPQETLFPALRRVLDEVDLLLALPDPQIYNSSSVQNIFLATLRAKVPLMAFSPAYVRAGALLALHVTPTQIGLQAGVIAQGVLQGKALPATPLYSKDFEVSVNEHVARSLSVSLNPSTLRQQLQRHEGVP